MSRLTFHGLEPIKGTDGRTVSDFWSWAYGDLLTNTTRAVFAEYLVALALNVDDKPRLEWNAYDLLYRHHKIEVKAAGMYQSWTTERTASTRFDIGRRKMIWDHETNEWRDHDDGRYADLYIFAIHDPGENVECDPLELAQWSFYAAITAKIDETFGDQKSVALSRIIETFSPVSFEQLQDVVDGLIT